MNRLKDAVLAAVAMFGSALSAALGGWDAALQTLVICMALDYLSGIVVAGVFKRSDKSGDGALDSRAAETGPRKRVPRALRAYDAEFLDMLEHCGVDLYGLGALLIREGDAK